MPTPGNPSSLSDNCSHTSVSNLLTLWVFEFSQIITLLFGVFFFLLLLLLLFPPLLLHSFSYFLLDVGQNPKTVCSDILGILTSLSEVTSGSHTQMLVDLCCSACLPFWPHSKKRDPLSSSDPDPSSQQALRSPACLLCCVYPLEIQENCPQASFWAYFQCILPWW